MSANGTQAIDRAAELLSLVVLADDPPAFGDLVTGTGLAKSTASRLLHALERHRLVHKDGDGAYAAGPLFALYASRHEPSAELIGLAQPALEAISETTGETVNLAVVRGNTVAHVAQIDSTFLLGTTNWVDVEVPTHCSASGKVFLAFGAIALPATTMVRRTQYTVTSPQALTADLEEVRSRGYAQALGELELGLDAIASPVRDHAGRVVAALGLSGPSDRLAHQLPQLGLLLNSHALALSRVLGYQPRKEGAA